MSRAVSCVRDIGLAYTAAIGSPASRRDSAPAWLRPSSDSATSTAPAYRSSAESTVAPCRTRKTRVAIAPSLADGSVEVFPKPQSREHQHRRAYREQRRGVGPEHGDPGPLQEHSADDVGIVLERDHDRASLD